MPIEIDFSHRLIAVTLITAMWRWSATSVPVANEIVLSIRLVDTTEFAEIHLDND